MKRILAILSLVLCLAALPLSARGAELSKEQALIKQAKRIYNRSLATSGKESFQGYCGLMTSLQLYHAGINEWCITNDGNKQYDYYAALDKTTGGYYISSYAIEDYSMEEALNYLSRNGTRDVYNILVGFQATNTDAGAKYGHAVFINAILDGTVYLMESSDSALGGLEGSVIQCSIDRFVEYYSAWTTYEGMIHFGAYSDTCQSFETNAYLQTRFASVLRSEPCLVGTYDCLRLRDVAAGERLHATGIFVDRLGDIYYRVDDGLYTGYIAASAVLVIDAAGETPVLSGFSLPGEMEENASISLEGSVTVQWGKVAAVTVTVTDAGGDIVLRERMETTDLSELDGVLPFDLLVPGLYQVEVAADVGSVVVRGGELETVYARTVLHTGSLQVGQASDAPAPQVQEASPEGWVQLDGVWYFYRYGKPCTGWIRDCGVEYYLDETGAAVTGWQEVDGWQRYFSPTGAMVTGWLTVEAGVQYRLSDGTAATGWQEIGGSRYWFDDSGILATEGEIADGDTVYTIAPDGKATEKSAE